MTVLLPMLYVAAVYVATRRPKPVYAFADPTVLTVTEQPGPAVLHAPEPIYPAEAAKNLKKAIQESLRTLQDLSAEQLLERRQERWVNYGKFKLVTE